MVEFHPYGAVSLAAASKTKSHNKPANKDVYPASNIALFEQEPHDYKMGTILSAFLCCLPLGIIGMIYSHKVRKFYSEGNYMASYRTSEKTRYILQITVIFGALVWFGVAAALIYISTHHKND